MAVNTCDPALRSWVKSAHATGTDFPIQNLPYGVGRIRVAGTTDAGADVMVAIGDQALSLRRLAARRLLAWASWFFRWAAPPWATYRPARESSPAWEVGGAPGGVDRWTHSFVRTCSFT